MKSVSEVGSVRLWRTRLTFDTTFSRWAGISRSRDREQDLWNEHMFVDPDIVNCPMQHIRTKLIRKAQTAAANQYRTGRSAWREAAPWMKSWHTTTHKHCGATRQYAVWNSITRCHAVRYDMKWHDRGRRSTARKGLSTMRRTRYDASHDRDKVHTTAATC